MFLEWSRLKFTESGDPLTGGKKTGVAVPSTVRRWGDHVYISLPRWKVGMGSECVCSDPLFTSGRGGRHLGQSEDPTAGPAVASSSTSPAVSFASDEPRR